MSDRRTLTLFSDGLLSKWGFNDGDEPDEIWDYLDEQLGTEWYRTTRWHPILIRLVRERLLPMLDQRVEVYEIGTIHNPIRATSVDGVPVDDEVMYGRMDGPLLTPEWVEVPYEDVLALVREQLNGASPTPRQ